MTQPLKRILYIKIRVTYHCAHIKIVKIKIVTTPNVSRDAEKLDHAYVALGILILETV